MYHNIISLYSDTSPSILNEQYKTQILKKTFKPESILNYRTISQLHMMRKGIFHQPVLYLIANNIHFILKVIFGEVTSQKQHY